MLIDDIKQEIKSMKQLDSIESAAQDAERRQKNDADFTSLVLAFTSSVEKIKEAQNALVFKLTDETIQYLNDGVNGLENVISSMVVDESALNEVKQHITKKVNPALSKEWKTFHKTKTMGLSGKLSSIGSLVSDKNKIDTIRTNINNGSEWAGLLLKDDGIHTRLELLKDGIDQVNQLEYNLNLSDEIKDFLVKVTSGKARATDVNENIINWIIKENLIEKFVINFKN